MFSCLGHEERRFRDKVGKGGYLLAYIISISRNCRFIRVINEVSFLVEDMWGIHLMPFVCYILNEPC